MERARKYTQAVMVLGILLACCRGACALDPSLDISQYAHTAWKVREGFTQGMIFCIAQTPDGYLWLGTESGLYRFDGVRALPWQPPAGQQLTSNYISALLVARDGTLWIATNKGLASWKDDKVTQYPEVAGSVAGPLLQDRDGTIWFGLQSPGRICAILGPRARCYGEGTFGLFVAALYEDLKGNLWASATTGLWRWKPGPPKQYTFPHGTVEVNSLIESDDDTLLLASNDGLKQLVDGKIQSYALPRVTGAFRPSRFFRSSDGSLWVGTARDLLHLHNRRVDAFGAADGLSGDFETSIFEDHEGNVWVSTSGGLDRFREYAAPRISRSQGLSTNNAYSVQSTQDGAIWIGTPNGLNRWQNAHVTVYTWRSASAQSGSRGEQELGIGRAVTNIADSGLTGTPLSLGQDDQARLWVSTSDGVFYLDGAHFARRAAFQGRNTIPGITGDGHGNVWIGDFFLGLSHLTPGNAAQPIPWSQFGQKNFGAQAFLPDRSDGGLWLGFVDGGIAYFKDGHVRASYTVADGLGKGRVDDLRFGSRGTLWAATEGGLSRIRDSHIITLTGKNGLPCDTVHWLIEDDDHFVWIYTSCGLVRTAESELDAWANDPKRTVQTRVFDAFDGVRSLAVYGGYGPHVTKSPDGKIWFVTYDGVSVIDPHHLPVNKLPPPVHIEQITADGKVYDGADGTGRVRLPPLVRDLDIDYTALSLVVPEKVHFRVKLEGQDKDWRELVNVRHVEYTNLPPKHYRFRVTACNNSGVWNEEGATLEFVVPPAWFQTNWFRALCVAAFLALLWAAYRLRVAELEAQERKFREAVETMPALAFVARADGHRTFVNRGWVDYTRMTVEQAIGAGWQTAVYPDDLKRVDEKWRKAAATGEPLEYDLRLRRGTDGAYRWFQTRVAPLRDKRGKLVKWCGVANDIEDRKRAEQLQADLAHTNRVSLLGELAASIAHELKQPITGSMANARASLRWLKRDDPDLKEACDAIGKIERDGARANEIIDRLRALYKKTPPQRSPLDVNDVITEMVVLLRGEAHRHAVSIRSELAADVPKLTGDRVQIQQVLMNLMLNAIEAMHETGGVLMLKSELHKDGQVLISVSDTGAGLPADKTDQIFNAFFTTKPQGSGMGLAISRSIVESHGGRLWACPNDGRGATFKFTLPIQADAQG